MSRVWSRYQEGIFDFVLNGTGNGLVSAGPGSGKSTVIEEAVRRVPQSENVLVVAFNRHIRDELKERLEDLFNVTVHTCNSFGNAACKPLGWYKVKPEKVFNILKYDLLQLSRGTYTKENAEIFWKIQNPICKLIGLAKGHMVWTREELDNCWEKLAEEYDVPIPNHKDFVCYLFQTFDIDQKKTKVIDYDDQIAIPLRRGFPIPTFKRIFVDEAQDFTPAQIELTSRALCRDGRALYVGDRRQAIYQFRGADSRAMDNIQLMMDCTELPLSICYRCCKAVVREAQKIDPTLEWWEESPEGDVLVISESKYYASAKPGCAVLCRTTAPLVSSCLRYIRQGVPAVVKGRDLGDNLENLVRQISNDRIQMKVEDFRDLLREYHKKESEKLSRNEKEDKQIVLDDKVDTIYAIMEECLRVEDILDRFATIFSKETKENAINHMTIHKAKGLEADEIFILRPDQLPHKLAKSAEALIAEENLKFVAITRAKKCLAWVTPECNTPSLSGAGVSNG